jgi:hypothetical protein
MISDGQFYPSVMPESWGIPEITHPLTLGACLFKDSFSLHGICLFCWAMALKEETKCKIKAPKKGGIQ